MENALTLKEVWRLLLRHAASATVLLAACLAGAEGLSPGSVLGYFHYFLFLLLPVLCLTLAPFFDGKRLMRVLLLLPLSTLLLALFWIVLPEGGSRPFAFAGGVILGVAFLVAIAYPESDA